MCPGIKLLALNAPLLDCYLPLAKGHLPLGHLPILTVGKIFAHQKYTTGKKIAPNCLIYTPGVGISSKQLRRNVIEFTYLIYMA